MDIAKIVVASVALIVSGWSLYEADNSSRTLQRPEVMHRSAADELRKMQAQPEEPLVLYAAGGDLGEGRSDVAPQPLMPGRKAHPRAMRASASVEK